MKHNKISNYEFTTQRNTKSVSVSVNLSVCSSLFLFSASGKMTTTLNFVFIFSLICYFFLEKHITTCYVYISLKIYIVLPSCFLAFKTCHIHSHLLLFFLTENYISYIHVAIIVGLSYNYIILFILLTMSIWFVSIFAVKKKCLCEYRVYVLVCND